jgi:hypothetical protein
MMQRTGQTSEGSTVRQACKNVTVFTASIVRSVWAYHMTPHKNTMSPPSMIFTIRPDLEAHLPHQKISQLCFRLSEFRGEMIIVPFGITSEAGRFESSLHDFTQTLQTNLGTGNSLSPSHVTLCNIYFW